MYGIVMYIMKLKATSFDWDEGNKDKNLKHNVTFKEAEEVFFNKPLKIYPDVKHSLVEKRFLALGITNQGRKLAIIFTLRQEKIRVIFARAQSSKERRHYEK